MARFRRILLGVLIMFPWAAAPAASDYVPGDGRTCERGKGIERTLGMHGYRVVVSGGTRGPRDGRVKVQVWQNDGDDWVITERFLRERRTCVVRSGGRLHMMY
jgi:hypothetical protein